MPNENSTRELLDDSGSQFSILVFTLRAPDQD
jgi:hypothetical protein